MSHLVRLFYLVRNWTNLGSNRSCQEFSLTIIMYVVLGTDASVELLCPKCSSNHLINVEAPTSNSGKSSATSTPVGSVTSNGGDHFKNLMSKIEKSIV